MKEAEQNKETEKSRKQALQREEHLFLKRSIYILRDILYPQNKNKLVWEKNIQNTQRIEELLEVK